MKLIILFGITLIIGFLLFGYMHELVHQEILRAVGIDSNIEIDWKGGALLTVYSDPDDKCGDSCQLAHNINEAIGYHLEAFYVLIGLGIFFILIALTQINDNLKELIEVAQ